MVDLDHYFRRLMLRELDNFRGGQPQPADDDITTTTAATATEVADTSSPPATGQDPTTTTMPTEPANARAPVTASSADGEDKTKQPATAAQQSQPQTTTLPAAAAFQGKPLKLITIPNKTDRQRKNNGARQQRVYRLAAKFGVSPGSPRWVRGGRPFAQPAVPRSVVRTDGNSNTVEYNQFIHDGEGKVMLRMPGGWKRDLVRNRPQFVGVAIIDGFLWPRFSPNLSRRMTVDWGKSTPLRRLSFEEF